MTWKLFGKDADELGKIFTARIFSRRLLMSIRISAFEALLCIEYYENIFMLFAEILVDLKVL